MPPNHVLSCTSLGSRMLVRQPRCVIISVTLDVLWFLLRVHLAARLWTDSRSFMCFYMCGSQPAAAYSSCGRTRVWYARCLMAGDVILIFLRTHPRVWLVLVVMSLTWVFHRRSPDNVTPRYFASVVVASSRLCSLCWWMIRRSFRVNLMMLHLSGWNIIFQSFSHCSS